MTSPATFQCYDSFQPTVELIPSAPPSGTCAPNRRPLLRLRLLLSQTSLRSFSGFPPLCQLLSCLRLRVFPSAFPVSASPTPSLPVPSHPASVTEAGQTGPCSNKPARNRGRVHLCLLQHTVCTGGRSRCVPCGFFSRLAVSMSGVSHCTVLSFAPQVALNTTGCSLFNGYKTAHSELKVVSTIYFP